MSGIPARDFERRHPMVVTERARHGDRDAPEHRLPRAATRWAEIRRREPESRNLTSGQRLAK